VDFVGENRSKFEAFIAIPVIKHRVRRRTETEMIALTRKCFPISEFFEEN
jgi:hypothetical protein